MNPPLPIVVLLDALLVVLWLGMIYSLAKEPDMNQYAKLAASGALFASLFYLVLTGKIQASDYQTLAVGALGAVGGWHAATNQKAPAQLPDATKLMDPTQRPLFVPQVQNAYPSAYAHLHTQNTENPTTQPPKEN